MIRDAVEADIPRLLEMGERFHEESGWSRWAEFDADSFAESLREWIEHDSITVLIAENGFAVGVRMPLYFNRREELFQELLWWVAPECRNGSGAALRRELEARAQGCRIVSMTRTDALRPEAVDRLYRRAGYEPVEHVYFKRGPECASLA